jgi:hypothetical protein
VLGTYYYNLYELYGMLLTQILITMIVVLPIIPDFSLHRMKSLVSISPVILMLFIVDDYFNLIICGIVVVCQLAYLGFAYPLYQEFSWLFYRVFGTDTVRSCSSFRRCILRNDMCLRRYIGDKLRII